MAEHKKKRKQCEYVNFAQEVKSQHEDIKKNYEYRPCIGIGNTLMKKTKSLKNNCIFKAFGCNGKSSHKTNKSKHYKYYQLEGASLDA